MHRICLYSWAVSVFLMGSALWAQEYSTNSGSGEALYETKPNPGVARSLIKAEKARRDAIRKTIPMYHLDPAYESPEVSAAKGIVLRHRHRLELDAPGCDGGYSDKIHRVRMPYFDEKARAQVSQLTFASELASGCDAAISGSARPRWLAELLLSPAVAEYSCPLLTDKLLSYSQLFGLDSNRRIRWRYKLSDPLESGAHDSFRLVLGASPDGVVVYSLASTQGEVFSATTGNILHRFKLDYKLLPDSSSVRRAVYDKKLGAIFFAIKTDDLGVTALVRLDLASGKQDYLQGIYKSTLLLMKHPISVNQMLMSPSGRYLTLALSFNNRISPWTGWAIYDLVAKEFILKRRLSWWGQVQLAASQASVDGKSQLAVYHTNVSAPAEAAQDPTRSGCTLEHYELSG